MATILGYVLSVVFKHDVVFTPTRSISLAADESFDRFDRVAWVKRNHPNADLFFSIHADAFEDHNAEGSTVYYFSAGKSLAEDLAPAVCILPERNRGARKASFTVLKRTPVPAVLWEIGYVDDNDNDSLDDRKFMFDHMAEMAGRAAVIIDRWVRSNG